MKPKIKQEMLNKKHTNKKHTNKKRTNKKQKPLNKEVLKEEIIIQKKLLASYDPLYQSIIKNYIFYITSFICLFIISKYSKINLFSTIITFIIASFLGFVIHFVSHAIKLEESYIKQNNYIRRNKYLNNIVIWLCQLLDFHETIHHDSSVNKTQKNMIYEFILNFVTQGGFVMFICYIAKRMNQYAFLLWGLMYCSVHIINYNIVKSKVHEKHHFNKKTNYGIDIWDILFATKYDNDNTDIELINHYSINIVVITAIILLLIKYNIYL
jgi:hypothetical protein